ncbi:hypothetical protein K8I28_04515 [bacterium]|nr:hypothetical protein [bacterium]
MRDQRSWDSGREGVMSIACYKPFSGKDEEMVKLLESHVPNLCAWGLAAETPALVMRSRDGIFIEVFEWKSH